MYWYNRKGTSKCVLYREVYSIVTFIWCVHYWRFLYHCCLCVCGCRGEESVSGGPVVQPNPPAKRRFTETVSNSSTVL